VADYLAFEEKHRGTTAAVCAMHHVMRGAASVGDRESLVAKARVALVDVIIKHYLRHEDLDLLLGTFSGGSPVPTGSMLLERAIESPHAYVRAEALYCWSEAEAMKCRIAETLVLSDQLVDDYPELEKTFDQIKTAAKDYGEIDVQASRRKAIELLDRILKDYPNARAPRRVFEPPLMLRFTVNPPVQDGIPTVVERARNLRFRLAELQLGKPVPVLSGQTADGEEVSSEQVKGRLTVLLFATAHDGRSPKMREELTQLQEAFPDEIAVIEVLGFMSGEAVPNLPNTAWPVIPEAYPGGALIPQWTVGYTPGVVVIDAQGNLRSDTIISFMSLFPCVTAARKTPPGQE